MSRLKRFLRRVLSGFLNEQRTDINDIIANRYIAGKLFPLDTGSYHLLPKPSANRRQDSHVDLPVPPRDLWEGYGMTEQEYLASGRRHVTVMKEILEKAGAAPEDLYKVLDFGCAAGRLLRFYPYKPGSSELWGLDINAKYISWCQSHLSPPFLFATTTNLPHLPFEDNYFDLVYCGSVFTHITDLADAWFLELRRVLRKGGYAYITIQDKTSMQILLSAFSKTIADSAQPERNWDKVDGEPGTSSAFLHMINDFDKTIDLRS